MIKRIDIVILTIILFILGIAIATQFYSGKNAEKIIQSESNEIMAVEIAKVAKTNASLKTQVDELTQDLNEYTSASASRSQALARFQQESQELDQINGSSSLTGQGVVIKINEAISTDQLVDLINALDNVGAGAIAINNSRVVLNSYLDANSFVASYEIKALGNASVLESALTRKGGIMELFLAKGNQLELKKFEQLTVPVGQVIELHYATIVN